LNPGFTEVARVLISRRVGVRRSHTPGKLILRVIPGGEREHGNQNEGGIREMRTRWVDIR